MRSIVVLATAVLLTACASQPTPETSSGKQPATTPSGKAEPVRGDVRTVKSIDGSFDGEIIGTVRPNSRFSKLKIGMTMSQVNALIKVPDDLNTHETGKRWIPFYYGGDVRLTDAYYKGDGCLTYTGGNQFGGGAGTLITITADPSGKCFNS